MSEQHVIFGTGPLGQSVMRELILRGRAVRMVNRSGKLADAPASVEVVAGDAYNAAEVKQLTKDATVVYQCAQPQYHEWQTKFPPLQAAIVQGVSANSAKLIVGENTYMYGEVSGPITESQPHAARTRKGRVRAQMSDALLAAHRDRQLRVAIARGSDFFGPNVLDSALGDRAILPALQGKSASLGGKLDLPHTYTFINDFGKAMVILGEREEALGQAWHVSNDRPNITQRELMTIFFEEIGKAPKMSGVSTWMMALAGIFIPGARETVEMMYEFEKLFVVDSSRFERTFGMRATPIREAVKQTVAWYRDHFPLVA